MTAHSPHGVLVFSKARAPTNDWGTGGADWVPLLEALGLPTASVHSTTGNGVYVRFRAGVLDVAIPPTATDGVFFSRRMDAWWLSNQPVRVARTRTPNRLSLRSLLIFGSVLPPLSILKDVFRLPPGYVYCFDTTANWPTRSVPADVPSTSSPSMDFVPNARGTTGDAICRTIDAYLSPSVVESRTVIPFSGGLDSGLLATYTLQVGGSPLLAHYSFGHRDPDTQSAVEFARALDCDLHIMSPSSDTIEQHLIDGVATYPQPFSDVSSAHTFDLLSQIFRQFSGNIPYVLDGTGADGLLGTFQKYSVWSRAGRTPRLVLGIAAGVYRRMQARGLSVPTKLEMALRVATRLNDLPVDVAAVLAQNALWGVAYARGSDFDVLVRLADPSELGFSSTDLPGRMALLDLVHVCSSIFAQKSVGPAQNLGFEVAFPFLDAKLVASVLDGDTAHLARTPEKQPIKELLSDRGIPMALVERPKRGFVPPEALSWRHPLVIDRVERALVSEWFDGQLNEKYWRRFISEVKKGRPMPAQHKNMVWGIAVTYAWLESVL